MSNCKLLVTHPTLFQIGLFQKLRYIPSMSPKRKLADLLLVRGDSAYHDVHQICQYVSIRGYQVPEYRSVT